MYAVSYHMSQRRFRKFDWSRANPGSWFGACFYTSSDDEEVVNNYNHQSVDKQTYVDMIASRTGLPYNKARVVALGCGKYEYLHKCVLTMKNPFPAIGGKYVQHTLGERATLALFEKMEERYIFERSEMGEHVLDYLRDGMTAYNLDKSLRGLDVEHRDNPDDWSRGDFVRDFLIALGYDGIIQQPSIFFPILYYGLDDVRHYVAFPATRIKIVSIQRLPRY